MSAVSQKQQSVLVVLHLGSTNMLINNTYLKIIQDLLLRYSNKYIIDVDITISKFIESDIHSKLPQFSGARNVNVSTVENRGADLYPYLELLCRVTEEYDIMIKLHTKTISHWSLELLRPVLDIDALSEQFAKNEKAGIIGAESWLLPTYIFLAPNNINKIHDILAKQFNMQSDRAKNIDNLLHSAINPKGMNLDSFVCHNPDDFDRLTALCTEQEHWQNIHENEFHYSHGAYDQKRLDCIKFIGGTIFAMRGELLKKYKACHSGFKFLIENIEKKSENGYVSDIAGCRFTYTHASERIVQILCYLFDYTVIGVPSKNISFQTPIKSIALESNEPHDILICCDTITADDNCDIFKLCASLHAEAQKIIILVNHLEDKIPEILYDGIAKVVVLSNFQMSGSHERYRESVSACKTLIETSKVSKVYIHGLSSTHAIYAAAHQKCKIIMYIDENDHVINSMYGSQTLITYDFLKYVDKVITPNLDKVSYLQSWCDSQYLPDMQYVDKIDSIILNMIIPDKQHPEVNLDVSMRSQLYDSYLTYSRYISYAAINPDVVAGNKVTLPDLITHHYIHGISENRTLCRLPVLCKPVICIVFHNASSETTCHKVKHAQHLQRTFNVIIILLETSSRQHDSLLPLLSLPWEHPPIKILCEMNINGAFNYVKNLELAKSILTVIQPDLLYAHASASYSYFNAALSLNIPAIYHGWEDDNYAITTSYFPTIQVPLTMQNILCASSAAVKTAMESYGISGLPIHETISLDSVIIVNLFGSYLRKTLLKDYPHFKWGSTIYNHEKIHRIITGKTGVSYLDEYQQRLRNGTVFPREATVWHLQHQISSKIHSYVASNMKMLQELKLDGINLLNAFKIPGMK